MKSTALAWQGVGEILNFRTSRNILYLTTDRGGLVALSLRSDILCESRDSGKGGSRPRQIYIYQVHILYSTLYSSHHALVCSLVANVLTDSYSQEAEVREWPINDPCSRSRRIALQPHDPIFCRAKPSHYQSKGHYELSETGLLRYSTLEMEPRPLY